MTENTFGNGYGYNNNFYPNYTSKQKQISHSIGIINKIKNTNNMDQLNSPTEAIAETEKEKRKPCILQELPTDLIRQICFFLTKNDFCQFNRLCNNIYNVINYCGQNDFGIYNHYMNYQCKLLLDIPYFNNNHFKPLNNNWKQFFSQFKSVLKLLLWLLKNDSCSTVLMDTNQFYKILNEYIDWHKQDEEIHYYYTILGFSCLRGFTQMVKFLLDLAYFDYKNNNNTSVNVTQGCQMYTMFEEKIQVTPLKIIMALFSGKDMPCHMSDDKELYIEIFKLILNHKSMLINDENNNNKSYNYMELQDNIIYTNNLKLLNVFYDKDINICYRDGLININQGVLSTCCVRGASTSLEYFLNNENINLLNEIQNNPYIMISTINYCRDNVCLEILKLLLLSNSKNKNKYVKEFNKLLFKKDDKNNSLFGIAIGKRSYETAKFLYRHVCYNSDMFDSDNIDEFINNKDCINGTSYIQLSRSYKKDDRYVSRNFESMVMFLFETFGDNVCIDTSKWFDKDRNKFMVGSDYIIKQNVGEDLIKYMKSKESYNFY